MLDFDRIGQIAEDVTDEHGIFHRKAVIDRIVDEPRSITEQQEVYRAAAAAIFNRWYSRRRLTASDVAMQLSFWRRYDRVLSLGSDTGEYIWQGSMQPEHIRRRMSVIQRNKERVDVRYNGEMRLWIVSLEVLSAHPGLTLQQAGDRLGLTVAVDDVPLDEDADLDGWDEGVE